MNAKKAKKARALVRRLGKDWRVAEYKWMRRIDTIKEQVSYWRVLDPDSGRGLYRRLKRAWPLGSKNLQSSPA